MACATLEEVRAFSQKFEEGRRRGTADEFRLTACPMCHTRKIENRFESNGAGHDRELVQGVAIGDKIYTKDCAFKIAQKHDPELTQLAFEKALKLYTGKGVSHLYIYAVPRPAPFDENNN